MKRILFVLLVVFLFAFHAMGQGERVFSGTVVDGKFELLPGVTIEVDTAAGKRTAVSDSEGSFSLLVPEGAFTAKFSGKNIEPKNISFDASDKITGFQAKLVYKVAGVNESVTIQADSVTPEVEQRNAAVFDQTLFGRDDQVIQSLNAGINAGQHEGGGKSLEIRRFGFNLDHGGVNGGLKVMVDNFQQNQGTQAHGQGYLGNLKSLTPELVDGVTIINGPFSAAYGDFSGLGVVQIRLKESLPDQFTMRVSGGSFNSGRLFLGYSPQLKNTASFIAYEGSYSDGPFINKLRYKRHNFTGNVTRALSEGQSICFKLNAGTNDFYSSGQLPLDEVFAGRLDRFGFIDPQNGGKVWTGMGSGYYKREWKSGTTLKADAFVSRSLFDLYSNFTFFLADPIYGDEIQQHDSRLQEGASVQFIHPYKFGGIQSVLTVGGHVHANQINVGLYPTVNRNPNRKNLGSNLTNPNVLYTKANADVNNYAGYVQNGIDLADGHVHIELGLRWDYFNFKVDGFEQSDVLRPLVGEHGDSKFQPKASIVWAPFENLPISFYGNYGRGIASQDARGIVRDPSSPKVTTTDFYQVGTAYNSGRFSIAPSLFLIDNSNQQVYIPDDGTIELAGRSRSYGFELKGSVRFSKFLSFNGGVTQVLKAFYPGQFTLFTGGSKRIVVDSASHTTANGGLVFSGKFGIDSSLSWRHISNYRLDGEDPTLKASGNDVVDFSMAKKLRRWVYLNFSVDNVLDKRYFETQNYFESSICPGCTPTSRIHATPGYSRGFNLGATFKIGKKN